MVRREVLNGFWENLLQLVYKLVVVSKIPSEKFVSDPF